MIIRLFVYNFKIFSYPILILPYNFLTFHHDIVRNCYNYAIMRYHIVKKVRLCPLSANRLKRKSGR